jgi:hypothetical protein
MSLTRGRYGSPDMGDIHRPRKGSGTSVDLSRRHYHYQDTQLASSYVNRVVGVLEREPWKGFHHFSANSPIIRRLEQRAYT